MTPREDPHPADEALMDRYACGDETALQILMRRHMRAALAIADCRLRHTGLAEDAVQTAFIKAARNARRFDPSRRFASWFYAILRNVCADMARREARYRLCLREASALRASRGGTRGSDDFEGLKAALRRLRAADRDVLLMRVIDNRSFAEIAAAIGCSEEAAKKKGQRALRRLRRAMGAQPVPKPRAAAYPEYRGCRGAWVAQAESP